MSDARYLEGAERIARRLVGEALWAGDRCNWLGDAMEFADGDWRVVHRSGGPTLYDGTAGVALFLARVAAVSNDVLVRETAQGALRQTVRAMADLPSVGRLGFYSGWTGIAAALIAAGSLLREEEWTNHGLRLLLSLTPASDDGEGLDVIGGAAGAIPALLHLALPGTHELALALGDRLRRTARLHGDTATWNTMPGVDRPLTGYSHGTAGIATALAELGAFTGDGRWNDLAARALAYEARHFVAGEDNWPDFRQPRQPNAGAGVVCACAWCHGAPGIALGRLRLLQIGGWENERVTHDVRAALRATARTITAGLGASTYDVTLCHGLAGLAESSLEAGVTLGDEEQTKLARRVADVLLDRYLVPQAPWPCGVPGGGETPALLTGLAGIGYFLLRVAAPNDVPTILSPGDLVSPARAPHRTLQGQV